MIKILAIDDNRDNLIVLNALLSDAFPESKIFAVQTGAEGIFLAKNENPDVILLDLVMPGMDGFETCRRLKEDDFLKRIPVIILTAAKTETSNRIKALKLGAEAFLGKPIDESELTAQVSSMIRIKKSEDNVRMENLRLEEVVKERTNDLLEELDERRRVESELKAEILIRHQVEKELITAKERAEASDRLKTAFMNNISHEVRTPLNGILGFGELITSPGISPAEQELYLNILNTSSDRLLKTINDYMDISLIVSGNMEVKPTKFDLDAMIDEIVNRFSQRAKAKSISLTLAKSERIPETFQSDPELLGKLLINLVDNAIKYSQDGAIEIGYHVLPKHLRFYIRDEGIGISSDKHAHIFEHFVQEDLSHTRKFEGSGLGLSIAKGLVELLNGQIWVESEKGRGSIFWFTVPLEIE